VSEKKSAYHIRCNR